MDRPSHTEKGHDPAYLIAAAIEAEKKAAWFYNMMAEMTSDDVAQNTLKGLADDEVSHAQTLTNLYFEITGHGVIEPSSVAPEGEPNLFDFPSTSRRAALEFALKNEIKAAEFYQSQASACDSPRQAGIFRQLADTEREHAAYMRLQLSRFEGSTEH